MDGCREEQWEKVQEIMKSRYRTNENANADTRTKYSRKYAFSGMCQCAFCGRNLTRRSHNQTSKTLKPVWKCRTAANLGIENCPHSKSIDEAIIENAFLEMFGLLAGNFDDVLESVLKSLEETFSSDTSVDKLKKINKEISSLETKRSKLTDMLLDDKITEEVYQQKCDEIEAKLAKAINEQHIFEESVAVSKNVEKRMKKLRAELANAEFLDKFDRVVFESIVDHIVVGGMNEDETVDPYKLTFVLKGVEDCYIPDAKNRFKAKKVG